jgi:hypothetical protein
MILNHLAYYFGHHKDKRIIYFSGMLSDGSLLVETLKSNRFDECLIVPEDDFALNYFTKLISDKLTEDDLVNVRFINKESLYSIESIRDYVFAFDHYMNRGEVVSLCKLAPKKVVGLFDRTFQTFDVWEKIRLFTDEISLAKEVNPFRNEVLAWKKDGNTDIELSVIFPMYKVEQYLELSEQEKKVVVGMQKNVEEENENNILDEPIPKNKFCHLCMRKFDDYLNY